MTPFRVQDHDEGGVGVVAEGALFVLDELHTAFSTNSPWVAITVSIFLPMPMTAISRGFRYKPSL